jgi:hypothetical protein
MTHRTIDQICVSTGTEGAADVVYALCSDDTIWAHHCVYGKGWEQLPPIPQPELETISSVSP